MGMLVGSVTWGYLSDRYGRKKVPGDVPRRGWQTGGTGVVTGGRCHGGCMAGGMCVLCHCAAFRSWHRPCLSLSQVFMLTVFCTAMFGLLSAFAPSFPYYFITRIFLGMGMGGVLRHGARRGGGSAMHAVPHMYGSACGTPCCCDPLL